MNESEKAKKTSGACETMEDVRAEIDRLDRALVRLVAERQGYIEAAARIKSDYDTIRDEDRISDVLSKVSREAAKHGLSLDIAKPVWRELVERSIAHEFVEWDVIKGPARRDALRRK